MQLRSLLKRFQLLWNVLKPRRRRQLLLLQVLNLAAALGEVANLGALLPFLRLLSNPTESLKALGPLAAPLRNLPQQHLLFGLGIGFMAMVIISTSLRVLVISTQLRLSALITADLGEQVFAAVLQQPYPWHLRTNSSQILTNITGDVDTLSACVQTILLLGMNVLVVMLLGASLIALAPIIMLGVFFLLGSFYLLVFSISRAHLRAFGALALRSSQRSYQIVLEGLGGIRDILLDHSQLGFVRDYRYNDQRKRMANASININAQLPRYFIEGFAIILIVAVSLILALKGQGIDRQLPLLGVVALGSYRLLQPLQQCFGALTTIQISQVSLQRLAPLIATNFVGHLGQECTQKSFPKLSSLASLQFQDVSFRYSEDGPWVLRNLDLVIEPGERLALVGTTGSGKSTTSDLILGLLQPSAGKLLVDGFDLHGTPGLVAAWQGRVAHVPQQIYLSDASFAANIAFGEPDAQIDLHRVRQASQQAHISDLIESSTDGYATLVGERGVRLSGGQRQRIGIARALYKKAQLLVLDEATSALDNRTESDVMASIESLDRQITVIMIAHRLSTIERCDRVVMLDGGNVIGCGTYAELHANHNAFKELASTAPKPYY